MKAKDLAKLLGVSPATVSLVLNNKPGLSDALRRELTEKINELGCGDMLKAGAAQTPAGDGAGGSQPVIAYLSYLDCEDEWDEAYSFFPGVLEGAEMEAREQGCGLVVLHMKCEGNATVTGLLQRAGNVVGVIALGSDDILPAVNEEVAAFGVPCVCIDSYDPTRNLSSVNVDNRQSMHTIVSYLKSKGHREIGYVSNNWDSDYQRDRQFAFRRALAVMGLTANPDFFFRVSVERGPFDCSQLAEQFARADRLPTAIVAEDDREGVRTINALKQLGLRVPEDVSVIGFDNNPVCNMTDPPLTSVKNSRHLMGRECVALIQNLRRLRQAGVAAPRLKILLPTELVERASVAERT